jgi:hypothetical protein
MSVGKAIAAEETGASIIQRLSFFDRHLTPRGNNQSRGVNGSTAVVRRN